jgi:cysteine synthase
MIEMIVANNITDLIGRTPLLRIDKVVGPGDATLYAKLEWYNIGGSVKDRMALHLIERAKSKGRLDKDKTILEATSGNTGIALSMIAAAQGYKITIVMPESASLERRRIIKAYGAELILSSGEKGTGGAVELKQTLLAEQPEKYMDVNQFQDPANIMAHYQTTGQEILEQTRGKVDMVVVGVGTAGTGVGVSMRLKEYDPAIRVVGVMPKLGVSIPGLRNPGESNPTKLFRRMAFDEVIELAKEEIPATMETARRLSREEGLLVGASSGAIVHVALKKARELGKGRTIVAVLPDSGEKYLSTTLFDL